MIELRFGLEGEQPCTLEEVGRAFGVTRERIRQIENNTLKKLEGLPEAQALRDCVSSVVVVGPRWPHHEIADGRAGAPGALRSACEEALRRAERGDRARGVRSRARRRSASIGA